MFLGGKWEVEPNDYGIKLFGLADKNGFVYHTILYQKQKIRAYDLVLELVNISPTEDGDRSIIQHL